MEERIVYQTGDYDVRKIKAGHFEVYKNGVTAATRVGTFSYPNDPGKALTMAKVYADRRAAK